MLLARDNYTLILDCFKYYIYIYPTPVKKYILPLMCVEKNKYMDRWYVQNKKTIFFWHLIGRI